MMHSHGVLTDDGEEATGIRSVVNRPFFERFNEGEDGSERRAQLVRDVGEKFLPHLFETFETSDVEEDADSCARDAAPCVHA